MNESERQERMLLLEAMLIVWEQEVEENIFADLSELEQCIAWQVLALSGAYERHALAMKKRRG